MVAGVGGGQGLLSLARIHMNTQYLNFCKDTCSQYEREASLFRNYILHRIVPSIPTYRDILCDETNNTLSRLSSTRETRTDHELEIITLQNTLPLSDISHYVLGMTLVTAYYYWERKPFMFLKSQIDMCKLSYKLKYFDDIVKIFNDFDTPKETIPYYEDLFNLSQISNVIKHGPGPSFDTLSKTNLDILIANPHLTVENGKHGQAVPLLNAPIFPRHEHVMFYSDIIRIFWNHEHWLSIGEKRYRKTNAAGT